MADVLYKLDRSGVELQSYGRSGDVKIWNFTKAGRALLVNKVPYTQLVEGLHYVIITVPFDKALQYSRAREKAEEEGSRYVKDGRKLYRQAPLRAREEKNPRFQTSRERIARAVRRHHRNRRFLAQ